MGRGMGRGARIGVALILVVAMTACRSSLRRSDGSGSVSTPDEKRVGDERALAISPDPIPQSPAATPNVPSFVLRLTDDRDQHPQGIGVRMYGPLQRDYVSDAAGRITDSVPPGTYEFIVTAGCADTTYVHRGGRATLDTADGVTIDGELEVIWQHRFGPGAPVSVDRSGDWPVGRTVALTFTVLDHCVARPAPGARFPTFSFETSENLEVVGEPVKQARHDGTAVVAVSCTKPGDIGVEAVDEADSAARIDLFHQINFGDVPRCVAA